MPPTRPKKAVPMSLDDDGEDPVSSAEILAVLQELVPKKTAPARQHAAAAHQPAQTSVAAPAPPVGAGPANPVANTVPDRMMAYQRAAVSAKQRGAASEALHWLRRSKELRQAISDLLVAFPEPGVFDDAEIERSESPPRCSSFGAGAAGVGAGFCASSHGRDGVVGNIVGSEASPPSLTAFPVPAPLVGGTQPTAALPTATRPALHSARAAVSPSAPSALPWTPPGRVVTPNEEEDDDDDAHDYAEAIVSYQVLAWEIEQLQLQASGTDDDDMKVDALETRKLLLEASVSSGELSMPSYLERLRQAIPFEKAAAMKAKAGGHTSAALHSMRRAKMMTDELAEAEAADS